MRQVKKLVRGLKSRRPPLARSLQLWQCVCRTLKGASAILRNASCGAKQNSGKASHGSLSKRQSGRLLACVVCSIHGVHHTLLFFIFYNFTLHSTESSSNPHCAVLLLECDPRMHGGMRAHLLPCLPALEDDAMRAALERMRGGGGDFYRRVLGSRAARSQRRQNTAGAQLRRVFAKYCESGGVSGALPRGSSGASVLYSTIVLSRGLAFSEKTLSEKTLRTLLASAFTNASELAFEQGTVGKLTT